MRYSRQAKILELISAYEVETQEKLVDLLKNEGFNVTQATVSRDIKELHLVKTPASTGRYKYTADTSADQPLSDRLSKVFRETIKSVVASGNLIVIKTLPGCGAAAGEAIDSMNFPHIIGSIAGDNNLLLIADDPANVPAMVNQFSQMIK